MPSVSSSSSQQSSISSSSVQQQQQHRSRMHRLQDRRFHQRFPSVCPDEHLVNYFSCALVSDILLQGHLFITENYFAFYSNIFGHKKEILIPTSDVIKVTKEKTAKIIPNAVGVYTEKEKFVFSSLLSRDTAFRVIQQVWIKSTDAGLGLPDYSETEISPVLVLMCPADEDSSVSSGMSGQLTSDEISIETTSDVSPLVNTPEKTPGFHCSQHCISEAALLETEHYSIARFSSDVIDKYVNKVCETIISFSKLSRTSFLFVLSAVLLILLLLSTTFLLYRISLVHTRLSTTDTWYPDTVLSCPNNSKDNEVIRIVENLQQRIKHLSQIRQTLENLLLAASKLHSVTSSPTK